MWFIDGSFLGVGKMDPNIYMFYGYINIFFVTEDVDMEGCLLLIKNEMVI